MEVRRCMNCMREITNSVCGHCGYNNAMAVNNSIGLKPETFLKGRYLVGRILGQGGFGITYVGFDMVLNKKVAIKEYFPAGSASRDHNISNKLQWATSEKQGDAWREGCDHFLKEARRMAKIDSIPAIVRVRDTFFDNDTAYIIMDFVEGNTLKDYLKNNGIMPISQCIQLMTPLFKDLYAVHSQGLIHRDISPDNIIIQPDGSLKLLDFGAAKDMETMKEGVSQMVTKKGFSPPEQYMEQGKIGSWTDVYALTATIYYCITGKLAPDAMDRVMNDPITYQVNTVEPLTPAIIDVLSRGMAVKVEDRISNTSDLMNQFNMALYGEYNVNAGGNAAGASGSSKKASKNKKGSTGKKKNLKGIIIAAIISLVLIAGGVTLAVLRPWRVYVKTLGNTNSNVLNDGGFIIIPNQREFFVDQNFALYECLYDNNGKCFYIETAEKIDDYGMYLTASKKNLYYVNKTDDAYSICSRSFDSGEKSSLYQGDSNIGFLQYTMLSNNKEYLYFMEQQGDTDTVDIVRYNLAENKAEKLISDNVLWFNVYDEYIFYTVLRNDKICLIRTNLKGKKEKIIDSKGLFAYGFVENDTIFLYSLDEKAIIKMDLNGKETGGIYNAKMDTSYYTYAYADEWIYYMNVDGSIHRVRTNDNGDEVVLRGHYAVSICYQSGDLWFSEGMAVADDVILTRVYLMTKDGSTLMALSEADVRTLESGVQYKLSGNQAVICGYVGDDYAVGIPLEIEGYTVAEIEENSLPAGHDYFLIGSESDFTYHENETGDGVVVDGYSGDLTLLMIPDTLGGLPVTQIGEKAFEESQLEKIALPASVREIERYAFYTSESLYDVQLNDGLLIIGECSFAKCSALEEITIPESVTSIGLFMLGWTNVKDIYVPASVNYIGATAFSSCSTVTISPDNPYYKLENNAIYTMDGKTLIEVITSTTGDYVVPSGVETVAYEAFYMCENLTSITLPETVTKIEADAFWYCTAMTSIYIPESVKYIGEEAFKDCDSLNEITVAEDCVLEDLANDHLTVNYHEPGADTDQ